MPGLDAGVALRAILRRFEVRCWTLAPSLDGVLGVGELSNVRSLSLKAGGKLLNLNDSLLSPDNS